MLQVDFLKCFQEKPVWKKNFNLIHRLIVNNQDLTNMYPCACLDLLIIFIAITGSLATIDRLELVMPKYAIRGGEATLKCDHSVPLEQLHKVEWKKSGMKIFQYVKGRTPPFRYFPLAGAELNKEHSSEKQIQLSKLDFPASGSYSCIVSMETPIFSKESESHELTVIEPQDTDPVITFNKDTYEIGEILEANCTTSPARPPPHVTWLINNERVDDSLTKPFSNGRLHGHGYFERKSSSTTQLSVEVSELHGGEDGVLRLTCVSTIPGYVSHNEKYADIKQHSVIIDIIIKETIPAEAISEANFGCSLRYNSSLILLTLLFFCL